MAITNPAAIRYCNEHIRPMADRLARCFYRCHELRDAWVATPGTNDEKMALLLPQIRRVSDLVANTMRFVWWADRVWQFGSIAALIPNDAAEIVFDNSNATGPDTSRSVMTGQGVRRLKNRAEEFNNWLQRGTDVDAHFLTDLLATLPTTYGILDDFGRLAPESSAVPTTAWGRKIAVERCGSLVTQWEVTVPANLTHILAVAVNPGQEV